MQAIIKEDISMAIMKKQPKINKGKKVNFRMKREGFWLINFIMFVLTSFSMSVATIAVFELTGYDLEIFSVCLVFGLFLLLIYKKAVVGYSVTGLLVLAFTGTYLASSFSKSFAAILPVSDSFAALYNYFIKFINISSQIYITIIIFSITTLLCITCFIILYQKERFFLTLLISIVPYIAITVLQLPVPPIAFYVLVIAAVIYYILYIYKRKRNETDNEYIPTKSFVPIAILMAIIIIAAPFFLNTPAKPLTIPWLDTKVNQANTYVVNFLRKNIFGISDQFSLSYSGFGNDQALGGNVIPNDTLVLNVKTSRVLYIAGAVENEYTGKQWDSTLNHEYDYSNDANPIRLDYWEAILAEQTAKSQNLTIKNSIWTLENHSVIYKDINTTSIFYPVKLSTIDMLNYEIPLKVDQDGALYSDNVCPKGFSYDMSSLFPDYSNPNTLALFRKSKIGYYSTFKPPASFNSTLYEAIKENSANIYKDYMNIPSKTPLRVKELAQAITKNNKSNFEKIKSIEGYLATHYTYNETPGTPPSNVDFVDYFLFDNKDGYCTHYASAMAVMARCIGLPSRYVVGYRVYPLRNIPGNGYYDITNYSSAHAWTEVYFEGVGWIPFEPTSIYYDNFYITMDKTKKESFKNTGVDISDPSNFSPVDELINNTPSPPPTEDLTAIVTAETAASGEPTLIPQFGIIPTPNPNGQGSGIHTSSPPPPELNNPIFPDFPFLFGPDSPLPTILGIIVGVILLIALWIMFNQYRLRRILSHAKVEEPNKAVIKMFAYYQRMFRSMGFAQSIYETTFEFYDRMFSNPLWQNSAVKSNDFYEMFRIFVYARYGNEKISIDEKNSMADMHPKLLVITKEKLGRTKYFIYKYLLGLF
jgi:transglutaminase-like putative cysteine protease